MVQYNHECLMKLKSVSEGKYVIGIMNVIKTNDKIVTFGRALKGKSRLENKECTVFCRDVYR